jgi:hypothetical protein
MGAERSLKLGFWPPSNRRFALLPGGGELRVRFPGRSLAGRFVRGRRGGGIILIEARIYWDGGTVRVKSVDTTCLGLDFLDSCVCPSLVIVGLGALTNGREALESVSFRR